MFEMKNPNLRFHVVTAFSDTVALHPLTPELIKKLALWMKGLREQSVKAKNLRQKYLNLQEEERENGKSFEQFVKEYRLSSTFRGCQIQ